MANNIRFDLQVSGGQKVATQFRKVAKEVANFAAAVKFSQDALRNSFVKGIASANQFTIQFQTATRKQINAEAERVRQAGITERLLLRQRERENRARERDAAKAIKTAQKEAEDKHRVLVRAARRANAARAKEELELKRGLARRVKEQEAAAARAAKAEAAALAKRLAAQKAFFARLTGLAQTANAALIRALGSIGLSGPAFRGVGTSVGKTFEKLGTDGGKSFVGGLVKTITSGLATIPKLIGEIAGPLLQAFGSIIKALGASIPALAGTIGATLGAALAPFSAGLSVLIPLVTAGMGAILGVFTGAIGGIAQALGGLLQGVTNAMSSILTVVGDGLAKVTDILVSIGTKVFSAITDLVGAALGAITSGIQKVFGTLTGLAGKAIKTLLSPATLLVTALSVKATKDINDKIIDAFALLDDRSSFHLGNVRSTIFELSRAVGVSSNEIATLLFDVISAGFRDTASAFEILQRSAELAVAGSASVAASGEAIVSSLIAQKRGAEDSAEAMRFLFAMQDRGRVTVQDAAEAVAGLSASMIAARVPAEELAGAYSALSLQGIPAAAVTTQLRELILNLAAPTPLAAAAMRSLGIEIHNLTDEDERFLQGLRGNIETQEELLSETEKGTAAYRRQRTELTGLKQELATQERVKGQFVGIQQAVQTIAKALAEGGDEAIRFARVIVPRKRARDALAFLAQNIELLNEKINQATQDFGKFDTALTESQSKVGVELTKTVTALRQLGVEIFNLGTSVTGGRGFELVRSAIDRIRSGIISLQRIIPGLRDDFLSIAGTIVEAFRPITDLGLVGVVRRTADIVVDVMTSAFGVIGIDITRFVSNTQGAFASIGEYAKLAFDVAIGAAREFAEIFAGTLSFQDSAFGSLLRLAGNRIESVFIDLKARFFEFRDVAVGALAQAFSDVQELLVNIVSLFAETIQKVVESLPSGFGLIKLLLFGPDDLPDVGNIMKGIVREVEAAAASFATRALVFSGAEIDLGVDDPITNTLNSLKAEADATRDSVFELRTQLREAKNDYEAVQYAAAAAGPEAAGASGVASNNARKRINDIESQLVKAQEHESKLLDIASRLIDKKYELIEIQDQIQTKNKEEREAAESRRIELQEEIALEQEVLNSVLEELQARGEATRAEAISRSERRAAERELAALRKEAIRDALEVARFENRRIDLAKDLGFETEKQQRTLDRVLNRIERVSKKEIGAKERAEELVEEFQKLVELADGAGLSVEALAEALDKAGKGIGNLQGIGGLVNPTGSSAPPPGPATGSTTLIPLLDELLGITEESGKQTIAGFEGGVDDLKRFLGQGLTVSFTPKSATLLERLAGGTAFEQKIAKAFRQFGQPQPGVGSFVGQAQLERGEGFLPLEGLPKELIESFETTLGPSAPVVTRLETLIEAIDSLQFARRNGGEVAGPRLGGPQGFQVSGAGEVVGVRPDALSSKLVQDVLQGIASRETVLELLDSLGLQLNSLDGIKKILEEQLKIERGFGDVSAGDLSAAQRGQTRGQAAVSAGTTAAFGAGTISSADTKKLIQLNKELSDARDLESIASAAQAGALAKLKEAQKNFKDTLSPKALLEVTAATAQYLAATGRTGQSSSSAAQKADELSGVLDGTTGKATGATKAFAGLQEVLRVFTELGLEKTGKSLAEFAKELDADRSLQRLLQKAEKDPEGQEAKLVDKAKTDAEVAAKDPSEEALENLQAIEEAHRELSEGLQEDLETTKAKTTDLGLELDTTGLSAEGFKDKVAETGKAALGAIPFLGSLIEQINLLRDSGAEIEGAELGGEAERTRGALEAALREAREKATETKKVTDVKTGDKEKDSTKSDGEKAVLEALKAAEEAARQSEEILAERSKAMTEATDTFRASMKLAVESIIAGFNAIQTSFIEVRVSFEEMTTQLTDVAVPAIEENADETVNFAERATSALETMSQTLDAHTAQLASLSARVTALGG